MRRAPKAPARRSAPAKPATKIVFAVAVKKIIPLDDLYAIMAASQEVATVEEEADHPEEIEDVTAEVAVTEATETELEVDASVANGSIIGMTKDHMTVLKEAADTL